MPETPAAEAAPAADEAGTETATSQTESAESDDGEASPTEAPVVAEDADQAGEASGAEAASGSETEAVEEKKGPVFEPVTPREALVAPDLSDLPDDIGDDFEAAIAATVLEFKEGDIVEGTVVSVDADGAMMDIGYKSEGLIPTREISIRNNVDPTDAVKVGDRVEAVVLNKEDDEGRLILSKKRAMYE
ncbi:MAG: S1 RNA-binding domain-containing protein, partial [Acidimicrobiia bacterium]|nr:S1 RNA-binding domain-containing protein [Acidimicrobiia bacterium]